MWLGKQQRKQTQAGEGQVGRVTIGGERSAVELDCERRGLEVYSPGGYHWTPKPGQKVLVIEGRGEIPCVAGLRQGEVLPDQVKVEADGGSCLHLHQTGAALKGERLDLDGEVWVNKEKLEELIARIVVMILGGAG